MNGRACGRGTGSSQFCAQRGKEDLDSSDCRVHMDVLGASSEEDRHGVAYSELPGLRRVLYHNRWERAVPVRTEIDGEYLMNTNTPVVFKAEFEALTAHSPLRWQARLFERMLSGAVPTGCDLPTGLGKTSVIPIWCPELN